MNKNKYLIQVSFKNSFFVLELSLETVFKYVKDSQEVFKWPKVFLMKAATDIHVHAPTFVEATRQAYHELLIIGTLLIVTWIDRKSVV